MPSTTIKQDLKMVLGILGLAAQDPSPSIFGLCQSLQKLGLSHDDRPIEFEGGYAPEVSFIEKVRRKEFSNYCEQAQSIVLRVGMCVHQYKILPDPMGYPTEVYYLALTRFGKFFLQAPGAIQLGIYYVIDKTLTAMIIVKKYKWLGSLVGICNAAWHWKDVHEISSMLIVGSLAIGVLSTLIWASIIHWIGHPLSLDDDLV